MSQVPCTISPINNRKYTKCTWINSSSRGMEEENYIMKSAAIFMISYFVITIIEEKIVLHQWIMYTDELAEDNSIWYLLPGKWSTFVEANKVWKILFTWNICKNAIFEIILWGASIKDDTETHEIIVNIRNIGNKFRTTIEPNLIIYFNELMNVSKPFTTKVVGYNTGISLWYYKMNSY